jgi:ubiquinol-cytochrome c reductase cytochrome b subunit
MNWVAGAGLAVLSLAEGFTGYSLPDDLLSGNGLRIIAGIVEAIPVVGSYLMFFIFGGQFPGEAIIPRLFIAHVLIVPAAILGLIGVHLALVVLHKHTQFPAPGRTERNVVGYPVYPVYAAKAGGFFFIVFGVVVLVASFVTINPIWNYGPYDPSPISAGTQPDWYIFFMDGALRLMPGWEIRAFGHTVANPFFPGALLPGLTFAILYLWPFLERRFTGDRAPHNLLDHPRDAPVRTGLGAATLTFYAILFLAGGNDVLASVFRMAPETITNTFRIMLFLGPVLAFFLTRNVCRALAADRAHPTLGPVGSRVRRTPEGGFEEVEPEETPAAR